MGNSQPVATPSKVVDMDYEAAADSIRQYFTPNRVHALGRPNLAESSKEQRRRRLYGRAGSTNRRSSSRGGVPRFASSCRRPEESAARDRTRTANETKYDQAKLSTTFFPEQYADISVSIASVNEKTPDNFQAVTTTTSSDDGKEVSLEGKQERRARVTWKPVEARQVEIDVFGALQNHVPFLHPEILPHLILFLMDVSLSRCFCVCPHWFLSFYCTLMKMCQQISDAFKAAYQDHFTLLSQSSISIQPLFTSSAGLVRIDYLIYCQVKQPCCGKCTQLGYTFEYHTRSCGLISSLSSTPYQSPSPASSAPKDVGQFDPLMSTRLLPEPLPTARSYSPPQSSIIIPAKFRSYNNNKIPRREYNSVYRFETQRKSSQRNIWLQRDMCRFHGDELMVASLANVPTVNVDDYIEVSVNLANGFGLTDIESIQWMPLMYVSKPASEYGQRCELERPKTTWFPLDTYQQTTTERLQENLDTFVPHWRHIKTEFTGVDISISRSVYSAESLGDVGNSHRLLGVNCIVKSKDSPVACTLPRLGLQHDRFTWLQLRKGDIITLYVSQGGGVIQ